MINLIKLQRFFCIVSKSVFIINNAVLLYLSIESVLFYEEYYYINNNFLIINIIIIPISIAFVFVKYINGIFISFLSLWVVSYVFLYGFLLSLTDNNKNDDIVFVFIINFIYIVNISFGLLCRAYIMKYNYNDGKNTNNMYKNKKFIIIMTLIFVVVLLYFYAFNIYFDVNGVCVGVICNEFLFFVFCSVMPVVIVSLFVLERRRMTPR